MNNSTPIATWSGFTEKTREEPSQAAFLIGFLSFFAMWFVFGSSVNFVAKSMNTTYVLFHLGMVVILVFTVLVFVRIFTWPNALRMPKYMPIYWYASVPWVSVVLAGLWAYFMASLVPFNLTTPEGHWRVNESGEVLVGGHAPAAYDPWRADSVVVNSEQTFELIGRFEATVDGRNPTISFAIAVSPEGSSGFRAFLSEHSDHLGIGESPVRQAMLLTNLIESQLGDYSDVGNTLYQEAGAGVLKTDEVAWLIRFDQLARAALEADFPFGKVEIFWAKLDSIGST